MTGIGVALCGAFGALAGLGMGLMTGPVYAWLVVGWLIGLMGGAWAASRWAAQ